MKISTAQHKDVQTACGSAGPFKTFLESLPGKASFTVAAIRSRAGVLNLLIGIMMMSHLFIPDSNIVLYLSSFLLLDMAIAVLFGLVPLSPTGLIGTLLSFKARPIATPHLPKRFAWSMGASLAMIILALSLANANEMWISLFLVVFFTLTWLDAVLGFCLGCWLYSKLFGCESCQLH